MSCKPVCTLCDRLVISQAVTFAGGTLTVNIPAGTEEYPLTNKSCAQVTACALRTRTRYSVVVSTSATGGTFKMLGRGCCAPNNALASIDGTAPA